MKRDILKMLSIEILAYLGIYYGYIIEIVLIWFNLFGHIHDVYIFYVIYIFMFLVIVK